MSFSVENENEDHNCFSFLFNRADKKRAFEGKVNAKMQKIAERLHCNDYQKEILKTKRPFLIRQATDNAGINNLLDINPAFFSPTNQDKVLKELDELVVSVGAPRWQSESRLSRSISTPNLTEAATHATATKTDKEDHSIIAKNFLTLLKGEFPSAADAWKAKYALKAIFLKRDPELLAQVREMKQTLFKQIAYEAQQSQPTEANILHYNGIIFNLLSYYVFLDPQPTEDGKGKPLTVPQLIEGKWVEVDYNIKKIELTDKRMGSPLTAFLLEPILSEKVPKAPPLMLFKGTTYPTDDGFFLSLVVDMDPFNGVGGWAFNEAKPRLEELLENAVRKSGMKARAAGQSLGGSLTQKAAIHLKEYIEEGFAFDPPGLSERDLKVLTQQQDDKKLHLFLPNLPKVNVFCQQNDPIHLLDEIPQREWKYYRVSGQHESPGRFLAHAMAFTLHKNSIIAKINPVVEANSKVRRFLTTLKKILSYPFFYCMLFLMACCRRIDFADIFNERFRRTKPLEIATASAAVASAA